MQNNFCGSSQQAKQPLRRTKLRRQSGQAIAAGTASLWLMSLILVIFVSVSLFIGNYVHATSQLTYVAQQAALYGMNQTYYAGCPKNIKPSTVLANTQAAMVPILKNFGFPDATVDFAVVTINGGNYGKATVTSPSVPMLGGGASILGSILPNTLTITQTALTAGAAPPFIADLAANGGTNTMSSCLQIPAVAAANPYNGGTPSYFAGSIGGPGANDTGAPGYVIFELNTTINDPSSYCCSVARPPYSAGAGWAY